VIALNRGQKRGTTLAELAVASFLLAILLTLTHLALIEGVKKQQALREEIELQQDALAIMARLSRETAEGHSPTFWPDRAVGAPLTMPGGEPTGFVFLSPRDADGHITLDATTNRPIWQKRVCYYFDPTTQKVFRAEEPLATPSSTPPPRDDTKTTEWFQTNLPSDPLPGQVESFNVNVGATEKQLEFQLMLNSQQGTRRKTLEFIASATMSE
jgi:hypothetical protein